MNEQERQAFFALAGRLVRAPLVLRRRTCDWIVDEEADTAVCRKHGEVADGVDSAHFPGANSMEAT